MRSRSGGFTLVELMVVMSIILALSAIAIPNLLSARLSANETSAITTLRAVSSAEAQFQASAKCDVDLNGTGEFGLLRELSGASGVRRTATADVLGTAMNPPVLSGIFRTLNPQGELSRSGYWFHVMLPGPSGAGVPETSAGALSAALDTTLCESTWCCYAWPSNYARSGARTFFINQSGSIVTADDAAYSGSGSFLTSQGAAFAAAGGAPVTSILGQVAVGTRGRDGNTWKAINPR
jgi:prepilin-type N-terminal cleavage/methylation domain-containing protein